MSLRGNFSWAFIGNLANASAQFGVLLVLARFGSPTTVGQYALALAITAPLFLFLGLSLRDVYVTDASEQNAISHYFVARLTCYLVGIVFLVILTWVLQYAGDTSLVILLVALNKAVDGVSDMVYGYFQKREEMQVVASSLIAKAVLSLLAFSIVMFLTGDIVWAVASMVLVAVARLLVFDALHMIRAQAGSLNMRILESIKLIKLTSSSFPGFTIVGSLMFVALPVGVSSSLNSLGTNIPRFLLEWSGSTAALGVFAVISYPLAAGTIVMSAVAQATLPRLSRLYSGGCLRDFLSLLLRLLMLAAVMSIAAIVLSLLVGKQAIQLIFGEEYTREFDSFLILIVGMCFGFANWFLNSALQAARSFRNIMLIQIATTLIVVVASSALVPVYGIRGAALSLAGAACAQTVLKSIATWNSIRNIPRTEILDDRGKRETALTL